MESISKSISLSKAFLFCVFDNTFFPDEVYLHFSWIVAVCLDLCRDFLCAFFSIQIGYSICIDEDSHFSSSREGVCFIDSREAHGDIFHLRNTFDVVFYIHTASSRADGGYRISNLHNFCFYTDLRDIIMMPFDDIDDFFIESIFSPDTSANFRMRSFDIVVHRFSQIMQKSSFECQYWICPDEFCDSLSDIGNLL